jgi:hypothetical protein
MNIAQRVNLSQIDFAEIQNLRFSTDTFETYKSISITFSRAVVFFILSYSSGNNFDRRSEKNRVIEILKPDFRLGKAKRLRLQFLYCSVF